MLNSTHISPFIGFHFSLARSLARLNHKVLGMTQTKLKFMWNVSIIVIILHCVSFFFNFFLHVVTWRLMIRNKLIHKAEWGGGGMLFISKAIHMLCCQHIFALSSVECLYDAQVQEILFFSRFSSCCCCWRMKRRLSNMYSGGRLYISSSIDICSYRRLPLHHFAVFWISRNTHVQIWIF